LKSSQDSLPHGEGIYKRPEPTGKFAQTYIRILTKRPYRTRITPLFVKLKLLKLKDICTLEI